MHYKFIKQKMCKNEKCAKYDILYIFEKPLNAKFKVAKIFAKFLQTNFFPRKTENVQILFKGICAKIYAKFLGKNC